jgi:tetratricopeptide (TPR) repeat protein
MDEAQKLIKKAEELFGKEQYKEIISLLTDELLIKYNNSDLYCWRAAAHNRLMETEKAFEYIEKAMTIDPNNSFAYRQRANAWYYKGDYDKAITDYNKAIELKNDYADAYNERGIAWYYKRDYDKAIADYGQAIKFNDLYLDAYFNRGLAHNDKGQYENSIIDFSKAIELKPDDAEALSYRGNVYYSNGDFQKALDDFEKAISLDNGFKYLEYSIKLAKEKLEERKVLDESNALTGDKEEKIKIENEIVKAINIIKAAAGSEVKTIVHYTKVFVADIYVKSKAVKMHYSNAIYMNDPMEGKVFFEYLNDDKIKEAYDNGEKRTETSVYLGSFLPAEENDGEISHEDELVMWRTYGKDENGKEAAGCSVVLSSDFFKIKAAQKEGTSPKDISEELLNVVYIKSQKYSKKITNDAKGKIESSMKILKEQLKKLIKLRNKYKPKDDFYREIENTVFKQLSTISYLFKSADYEFEHEVRVITYMPRNSDTIKFREVKEPNAPCKRFYIESYNDILPYVKKIYLGPKVENYQQWSLYFDYEIRQRAKEIEAIPTPPYQIKPSDIEIMKSVCKFQ